VAGGAPAAVKRRVMTTSILFKKLKDKYRFHAAVILSFTDLLVCSYLTKRCMLFRGPYNKRHSLVTRLYVHHVVIADFGKYVRVTPVGLMSVTRLMKISPLVLKLK
jgi:hypothetical protein